MPYWLGYIRVDDVDVATGRFGQLGGKVHHPPTDIPNISRFSLVADPQMAMLALVKGAKPAQELPSPSQMGNVGWHELFAADPEKAFAFYSEIFGWQKAEGGAGARPNYQPFSAGGEIIGGLFNKVEIPADFMLALLFQCPRHRCGRQNRPSARRRSLLRACCFGEWRPDRPLPRSARRLFRFARSAKSCRIFNDRAFMTVA